MSEFEILFLGFRFVSLTFWSLICVTEWFGITLLGFSCVERLEIWICLRADPALLCFRLPDLVRQSELVVREPVGVLVCRVDTWVGILGRYMIGSLCLLSSFSSMGIVGSARYPHWHGCFFQYYGLVIRSSDDINAIKWHLIDLSFGFTQTREFLYKSIVDVDYNRFRATKHTINYTGDRFAVYSITASEIYRFTVISSTTIVYGNRQRRQ